MMEQTNPKLTIDVLNELERRIVDNTQTVSDLKKIANYIDLSHKDYLIDLLRKRNVHSYEQFIKERSNKNNPFIEILVGNVVGVISFLKSNLINQI